MTLPDMQIRMESSADLGAIREVHRAAFALHPLSQQTEHLIVDALRADGALSLSLVADEEGRVAGHIAFSPVLIGGHALHWYALGPVGVLPSLQNRGIGSSLVREGLTRLRALGAQGCVLVGEPSFYSRFGFRHCGEVLMEDFPPEVVLCLAFYGVVPQGKVEHHRAFWVQPDSDRAT